MAGLELILAAAVAVSGYLLGYFTDRKQIGADKDVALAKTAQKGLETKQAGFDLTVEALTKQVTSLQARIFELENRIDEDRKRYQKQIDKLQEENKELHVELATIKAKCSGCLGGV